jgi:hypothetical protein
MVNKKKIIEYRKRDTVWRACPVILERNTLKHGHDEYDE